MTYHRPVHRTEHLTARTSQRGISKEMLDLDSDFGAEDSYVLDRNRLDRLLVELAALSSLARPVRDKGGMVVIEKDGAQLTTCNLDSYRRGRR